VEELFQIHVHRRSAEGLQNLLKERVSIRDGVTILETLADYGAFTKNVNS